MMAASHFLSIVPLHENRRHQARFLEACNNILNRQGSLLGLAPWNEGQASVGGERKR